MCRCCVAGDAEGFGKEHVNQEAVEVDSAAVDVSVAGMTSQGSLRLASVYKYAVH